MNNRRSSLGIRIVIPDTNIYHESLTVPDSHDAEGREDNELAFFSALSGQHGFPDTAGGISAVSAGNVDHVHDPHPSVAPELDIVQDKSKKALRFDTAVHKGARCTTKCESLLDREELVPAMSVYVAIDSMIAVLNAYLSGWLHCGINVTTMLLREEAQYRTPEMARSNACFDEEGFEFLHRHLRLCLGVLGDGDHAVKWEKVQRPSYRRIGIQPFLSMHLLDNIGKEVIQTPLDDVESIIWTVIWAGTFNPDATPEECSWRQELDHHNSHYITLAKFLIINYFQDPQKENTMSLWFQEILPLLRQWLELMKKARYAIDRLLAGKQPKPAPPISSLGLLRGRNSAGPSETGQTRKDFRSQERVAKECLPKPDEVVDIDGDKLDNLIREHMKKYLKAGVDWLEKNRVYDDLEV